MLALKYLLMLIGLGLLGSGGALVVYDVYVAEQLRRLIKRKANGETGIQLSEPPPHFLPVRWRQAQRLAAAAVLPVLLALSIVVIPDGSAGVRISQIWGARPGTLYPGVHLVTPLIDSVSLYDTREQVYQTLASESDKKKGEVLAVQAREGLNIGLAVSVRYRLDPRRLDSIHTNLPQPVGEQVVAPVVSTIYRQLAPNYMTREIFATKREELRSKAAELITARLASDGIVVREVLLRDLQLAGGIREGAGRPALEGTGRRAAGHRDRDQVEGSENCGAGSGGAEGARRETGGSAGAGAACCRPRRNRTPCNTRCR